MHKILTNFRSGITTNDLNSLAERRLLLTRLLLFWWGTCPQHSLLLGTDSQTHKGSAAAKQIVNGTSLGET